MPTDDPTDDLHKPLGQHAKRKKKPFVLPIPVVMRAIAVALCVCVAVLAGWILFVDEPFGGEPMVVVSAQPNKTGGRASGPGAGKPDAAPAALAEGEKSAAPNPKTVTIIDGTTGKRQEVTVGQSGAAPAAEKKVN